MGRKPNDNSPGSEVYAASRLAREQVFLGDGAAAAAAPSRDTTERERAEEALRESEQRLAAFFENAPAIVWLKDLDGRFLRVNRRMVEALGKPEDEFIGHTVAEVYPGGPGDAYAANDRQVIATGTAMEFEETVMLADGAHVFRSSKFPLRDAHGLIYGIGAICYDITDRMRAEGALAQSRRTFTELVERAPFGIYIVDSAFCIAYMNRGSQTGAFRNVRPVIGRPFNEVMHILWGDAVAEEIIGHFRRTLETGEPYFAPPFVNPRADIEVIEGYEWELHRIGLPDGQDGVICYYFDSTQIRAAEAELHRLTDELRVAGHRKDEFLAVLSHELRNPLAAIRNSLYVMNRAEPGGEQVRRAHTIIERQVSHLCRLVDDLLDAARIARGKLQMRRERLDLGELVRQAVEDHRSVFTATGVELSASVTTRHAWMQGDPTRLSQMIGNLLQNAAKFTPASGRVEASLRVEGGVAVLCIEDNGMGIAPELLARVFEPFEQAEQGLDRRPGGLGLGLAVAKTVADAHGGNIEAKSEGPGRGATFIVSLPVEIPDARKAMIAARVPHRPRRILVVEDNVDTADSLRDLLEIGGHTVAVVHSGAEAVTKAHEFLPEVVLCDIGLPGLDGYAVAHALRADEALRDVVLVAMTGYALPEDVAKATEAGFDQHLAKPIDAETLERALGASSLTVLRP